jgi:hypothetical protein
MRGFDELPDILTIPEVADYLRVRPPVVYELARRYRATGGREGLPVIMAGCRIMRVSRVELGRFIAGESGRGNPDAA